MSSRLFGTGSSKHTVFWQPIFPNLPDVLLAAMEYLPGGQIRWANEEDQPCLMVDQTRRIIRDVIVGLEYRKDVTKKTENQLTIRFSPLPWYHSSGY